MQHVGGSFSTGAPAGSQLLSNMTSTLLSGLGSSGHAEGVTRAAVSEGSVVIRDQRGQQQDVSQLSRDVASANGSISPIFDREKEQKRLQTAQLVGEIAGKAMEMAQTEGTLRATGAGKAELARKGVQEPGEKATREEWKAYNDALTGTDGYKSTEAKFGTGSAIQRGIQAATAALQGLVAGNVQGAIAGASAPYLAELIHRETITTGPDGKEVVNEPASLIAHAVLGAVVAQIQNNSALAGATGATAGEFIAQQLYPGVDRDKLSEEQKQIVSELGTLAAGLAGGIAGDSTASAVAGAQAGKNAVENNALSGLEGFGTGFQNNVQAQGSLVNNTNLTDENGKVLNPATPREIKYASDKLVTGELPAGQNAVTGLLTAWGAGATTVMAPVLLPATATAGSVIGAGAIGGSTNVFNQLNSGGPFSATDALLATGLSGLTQGKGFWFTELASITGAYIGAKSQGKDATAPMIGAGLGTLGGATIGKGVERLQTTIPQFTVPKITGAVAESAGSEYLGSSAQNLTEKVQQKFEKNSYAKEEN
ncbi:VENN motif pre-toxin domain-containing protein [Pantoea sp. MBD-2R]|uniref:VENN motif pre-toxin domain-containing protein n=1 Tax=Pantoea sp. MBD-2R TaxID=3141540 RepID=UPI003183EC04